MDCLFCKIAARAIPADVLSESNDWMAFRDVHPQAPIHCLIIPKRHLAHLSEANAQDAALLGSMMIELARLAKELGIDASGYRVVNNCRADGGQTVPHLHLHLLGGRSLKWPPG